MTTQLSSRDLEAVLSFVGEANSITDLDTFRSGILPGLGQLVPCDLIGYNEVDPAADGTIVVTYPEPLDDTAEALGRLAHEHPLITACSNGDLRTQKISDFMSSRAFHRLEIYDEIYSRVGAEDQIAFGLPGKMVIGIAMNRPRRDFSERDRTILDLIRPHLAHAHAALVERERHDRLLEMLQWGLAEQNASVIRLDRQNRIEEATQETFELLASWFPGDGDPSGKLAGPIAAWLATPAGERPDELVVEGAEGLLTVKRGPETASGPVLVLETERIASLSTLRSHGLTRRQAQVLRLIAFGRSTDEVAVELVISSATVRKHLEHIYERLNVNTREAAVAVARGTSYL